MIDVGKVGGGEQVPQDETTRAARRARARRPRRRAPQGRRPVRLRPRRRGGAGAAAPPGIPFEVVPGVTAGVAAPAYAGIPVTQRGVASAVAFVTGHEDPAKPETAIDWPALAALPRDARLLHGRARSSAAHRRAAHRRRARRRRAGGGRRARHAPRPAHGARDRCATIADARDAAAGPARRRSRSSAPVAALRDELAWLDDARRCAARTVAVTRARAQASALAARLRALGADVVEAPAIRIEPLDADAPRPRRLRPVCVTSPNGATSSCDRVRDARALAGPRDRGDRPRAPRAALREHGHRGRHRPVALGRRGARRRARGDRRAPRADRARRGGARRPARRAARARRRGRHPRALPDGRRAARRRRARGRARRRLRDLHLRLVGALLPRRRGHAGRPAARLDRPGRRAPRCASSASSPTSRRPITRRTGSSRRCSPTRAAPWRADAAAAGRSARSSARSPAARRPARLAVLRVVVVLVVVVAPARAGDREPVRPVVDDGALVEVRAALGAVADGEQGEESEGHRRADHGEQHRSHVSDDTPPCARLIARA